MKNKTYQQLASSYDEVFQSEFYKNYASFIERFAKSSTIKILDLACGTGSLIKELGNDYEIEGVDYSSEMLKIAKIKNPKIKFFNQDFLHLVLAKKYDIITCTFDSINYLLKKQDLEKAIKNISKYLNPHGLFIFDFNTKNKKIESVIHRKNLTFYNQIENDFWITKIEIEKKLKIYTEIHTERLYDLTEIRKYLEKNNLEISKLYENFENKTTQDSTAERLFVVAKKS